MTFKVGDRVRKHGGDGPIGVIVAVVVPDPARRGGVLSLRVKYPDGTVSQRRWPYWQKIDQAETRA